MNQKYATVGNGYTAPDPVGAQIVNDRSGDPANYRTVLDGYGLEHLVERHAPVGDPSSDGECAYGENGALSAEAAEVVEVLKWTFRDRVGDLIGCLVDVSVPASR